MKKKAFTLQELLITLGIVGVIAALTIPAITKMKPDETKAKYVKAYSAITNITSDLINDSTLYFVTYNASGTAGCHNLDCYTMPPTTALESTVNTLYTKAKAAGARDEVKYPVLLISHLNLMDEPVFKGYHTTFTTSDGVSWDIEGEKDGTKGKYGITINVNPNDKTSSHNCVYSTTCTSPNKFTFDINEDGGVVATDKLGKAFLMNPTDMHSMEEDKTSASKMK